MAGGGGVVGTVDVVVVAYRSAATLPACLASVVGDPAVAGVHVADNTEPGTAAAHASAAAVAAFPGVHHLRLGRNVGFGAASNRGAAASTAPFVLFLNPDAELRSPLAPLVAALAGRPELAAVGPVIRDRGGALYPSARRFPSLPESAAHAFLGLVRPHNRWSRRYEWPDRPDWLSGTALLVRRAAFEAVGGFDERYFMYVEDVDLARRLALRGWRVAQVPEVEVAHDVGRSSEQRPYRMIVAHHRSLWRYARSTANGAGVVALPLVAAALAVRAALTLLRRRLVSGPPAQRATRAGSPPGGVPGGGRTRD